MGIEELDKMSPKVREKYLEIIRAIPPGRKMEITLEFCDSMRKLVAENIRFRNPKITNSELHQEIIKRMLPEDIRKKVYGW